MSKLCNSLITWSIADLDFAANRKSSTCLASKTSSQCIIARNNDGSCVVDSNPIFLSFSWMKMSQADEASG